MSRILKLAAAQLGPIEFKDSRESTIDRLCALLKCAANQGCELVVFPELALTTFFSHFYLPELSQADHYYERQMPSSTTERLFEISRTQHIAFSLGYAEISEEKGRQRRFNTTILVDKQGSIVSKYRKIHLPGHKEYIPADPFQNLENTILKWEIWDFL